MGKWSLYLVLGLFLLVVLRSGLAWYLLIYWGFREKVDMNSFPTLHLVRRMCEHGRECFPKATEIHQN